MNQRRGLWIAFLTVWGAFTFWYTDFEGPVSEDEITAGMETLRTNGFGSDATRLAEVEAFFRADPGGQFLMVNIMQMNPSPPPMPGFDEPGTAQDYINHYMQHMFPQLVKRASHPVFIGAGSGFTLDRVGVDAATASGWDSAALFRYRSRRALLEIITHPDMYDRHEFKLAGLSRTIAYPVKPSLYIVDPRVLLFLVLFFVVSLIDMTFFGRLDRKPGQKKQP